MPRDPILLMSVVNTLLRDQYKDLDSLCEDREWNKQDIIDKLEAVDYKYNPQINQFR